MNCTNLIKINECLKSNASHHMEVYRKDNQKQSKSESPFNSNIKRNKKFKQNIL